MDSVLQKIVKQDYYEHWPGINPWPFCFTGLLLGLTKLYNHVRLRV